MIIVLMNLIGGDAKIGADNLKATLKGNQPILRLIVRCFGANLRPRWTWEDRGATLQRG